MPRGRGRPGGTVPSLEGGRGHPGGPAGIRALPPPVPAGPAGPPVPRCASPWCGSRPRCPPLLAAGPGKVVLPSWDRGSVRSSPSPSFPSCLA